MTRTFSSLIAVAVLGLCLAAAGPQGDMKNFSRKPSAKSPASESHVEILGEIVKIDYSAPSLRGRAMLDIVKQDPTWPVWRAGAQDATWLHTDTRLVIGALAVPSGDYSLFITGLEDGKWKLIINKQTGQWGLDYHQDRDLGRVDMIMSKPTAPIETLKWTVSGHESASGKTQMGSGKFELAWGNFIGSIAFVAK